MEQYVLVVMVFLFNSPQDLLAPSADRHENLPHDLGALYNTSTKIWGPCLKNFTLGKIWVDFTQLPTLIVNISGTSQDIQNWKERFLLRSAKEARWTLVP